MRSTTEPYLKAEYFDKAFDEGSDVSQYLEVSKARKPNQAHKKMKFDLNLDFPIWMFQSKERGKTFRRDT